MPAAGAPHTGTGDAAQLSSAGPGTDAAGPGTDKTAQDSDAGRKAAQDDNAGTGTAGPGTDKVAQDDNAEPSTTGAGAAGPGADKTAQDSDAGRKAAQDDNAGPDTTEPGAAAQHSRRMKRGEVRPGSAWALVTGAGSGIGRCYALQLAALGYRLVIVGNTPAPLEAVAEEIRSTAAGRPSAGGKIRTAAQPDAGNTAAGDADAGNTAAGDAAAGNTATGGTDTGNTNTGNTAAEDVATGDTAAGDAATGNTATGNTNAGNTATGNTATGDADAGGETTTGTPAGTTKNRTARPEVRVIPTDLARVGAAQELYDRIAAEGIGIDVVINNAGIFSFCDILTTPPERIERIVLLHDLTVSQLCRLYAADMVRRGVRGHILNMSSYSLWMPFPGLALYSASKAYMRSFSVAFAKEVRDRGIRVTAVCPAGVATDLYGLTPRWQRIGKRLGVLITPDSCARRGLRALWRGRRCIVPDWWNRAWIPLCKVLPMWVLRPIRRFTMKFQK